MKTLLLAFLLALTSCCSHQRLNPLDMTGKELKSEAAVLTRRIADGDGTYDDVARLREIRYQIKAQEDVLKHAQ